MPLDHKQPNCIAPKGMKKVYEQSSAINVKLQSLLVPMLLALYCQLRMVIFKSECLNYEWTKGEIPNTIYGMSPQGWIDQELFVKWLEKLFIENIPNT